MKQHIQEIAKILGFSSKRVAMAIETQVDPELLAPDPNLTIEEAEENFYQSDAGSPEAEKALTTWICLCETPDEIRETIEYLDHDIQTELIVVHKLSKIMAG